jgi:Uma2 family endonuclease
VVEKPRLIIGVLSESTERQDRVDKFYAYRRLDSLQESVLVAQEVLRVEVYGGIRTGIWRFTKLPKPTLNCGASA